MFAYDREIDAEVKLNRIARGKRSNRSDHRFFIAKRTTEAANKLQEMARPEHITAALR